MLNYAYIIMQVLNLRKRASVYEQQGVFPKDGIHDLDDYYGEFSRTSLYAFENAMRSAEHEKPSVMAELKRLSSRSVPEKDSIGMER